MRDTEHVHSPRPERAAIVAVIGAGDAVDADLLASAERVGALIAERGWVLLTGGRTGVMEAASAGARRAGGRVIGILPGRNPAEANPYVEIPIATGLGEARNAVIATAADALIAVGGEYGTLSEIALGLKLGKLVVLLGSRWAIEGAAIASSPDEAIEIVAAAR